MTALAFADNGPLRSPRPRAATGEVALNVEVADSPRAALALVDEWASFHTSSATTNPFTHPAWVLAWAQTFLRDDQYFVLAVRKGDRLVGVAPFAWLTRHRGVRALHLMGHPHHAQFTEMPGLLVDPAQSRNVMRRIMAFLQAEAPPWHWVRLGFGPEQGWFEPQWITKGPRSASSFAVPLETRAFVMMDLPHSWESFLATRKRNLSQSIRRSTNRVQRLDPAWSVEVVDGGHGLDEAVEQVIRLQSARAGMAGKPCHPPVFTDGRARQFYRSAVAAMAEAGLAQVSLLHTGGQISAGLVSLRSGSTVFTSVSAADPTVWSIGPGTLLLAELSRQEITRGTAAINLSCGPSQSKLRWSERLEYTHDFGMVGPTFGARARFGLYAQSRTFREISRLRNWNTRED